MTTNSAGNNAYFIKKNLFDKIKLNIKKNTYQSKFRESRDESGKKTFINHDKRLSIIGHLEVEDVETNKLYKISELL